MGVSSYTRVAASLLALSTSVISQSTNATINVDGEVVGECFSMILVEKCLK